MNARKFITTETDKAKLKTRLGLWHSHFGQHTNTSDQMFEETFAHILVDVGDISSQYLHNSYEIQHKTTTTLTVTLLFLKEHRHGGFVSCGLLAPQIKNTRQTEVILVKMHI